ncbi:hypothetical protein Godav_020606 [Gossypium davidsonii]|uniref:WAT1-related protein n=2 Tax=Gossypium TaxID=3633 RepID=A0A7J8R3F0_GOSDV|nr:hypothetical protein [Gossypium davidsonii]
MARRYCYNDVAPLIAMVTAVYTNVGANILFKEATPKGMNQYIFITYSYVVAALVLLPLSFIFPRRATVPLLKYFYLGSRLFLLGLIGFLAQICAYKGIAYSSPTLASAMSNLGPAFTFILAVLFRFLLTLKLKKMENRFECSTRLCFSVDSARFGLGL